MSKNESTDSMDVDDARNIQIQGKGSRNSNGQGEAASTESSKANDDGVKSKEGNPTTKSVEGWIIIVTGLHEESTENDVKDLFADFGKITSLHLNLDRRTGYVKGYALIEYGALEEAKEAINQTNGTKFLDKTIFSDFAILDPPLTADRRSKHRSGRSRSRSPKKD